MWNRFVLFFLCIFFIGYLKRVITEDLEYCTSNSLVHPSKNACVSMDQKINPCDDFYSFACGSNKKGKASKITLLERNRYYLKSVFEEKVDLSRFRSTFGTNEAIELYKSCRSKGKSGVQPIIDLFNTYGGWALVRPNRWYGRSPYDNLYQTKLLLNEGFEMAPILTMEYKNVEIDSKSSKQFYLGLPTFPMDRDRLVKKKAAYQEMVYFVAKNFFNGIEEVLETEVIDIVNIVYQLLDIYDQPDEFLSITVERMELKFRNVMLFILPFITPHYKKNPDIRIFLEPVQYFVELEKILSSTNDHTISNYIMLSAVFAAAPYLPREVSLYIRNFFNNDNIGNSSSFNATVFDEAECFEQVNELLPMVLDDVYISRFPEILSSLDLILDETRQECIKIIQQSAWIDYETKNKLVNKLNSIVFSFWRSPYLDLELQSLSEYELQINLKNYLQSYLNARKYHEAFPLRKNRVSAWDVHIEYTDDNIYIPNGVMEWPLFNSFDPLYSMNFGSIGFFFGHIIGHLIDFDIRIQDRDPLHWMYFTDTEFEYIRKADCFIKKYAAFVTEDNIKLNLAKTVLEDMSDIIGIEAAYRAYQRRRPNKNDLGPYLYSYEQLFWIAAIQTLCESDVPSKDNLVIHSSVHTKGWYRAFSIFKTKPAFSRDFYCMPDNKMFSENNDTCELW